MRYERKYKIEQSTMEWVREAIRQHPASFTVLYPERQVNNLYFDTEGFTCYKENVMGIAERKKFRVRWYGVDYWEVQKPILEIKNKDNALGWKESFALDEFEWSNLDKLTQEVNRLTKQFQTLKPTLLNSYTRQYFGNPNGKFRITIDAQLASLPFLHAQSNHLISYAPLQVDTNYDIIVELKYEAADDDLAQFIMQYLPFRQTKSSKYVDGIMQLLPS